MKFAGPVLLLIAGVVLGWIALAADDPTFHVEKPAEAPEVVPFELSGVVPAGFEVRDFAIRGICCNGCVGKLYMAAGEVAGVREVAVDPVEKQVEVVVEAGTDPALIVEALTFDKYTAQALAP
ncbi:MAG TPA: hypothetical protein ENJ09_09125 [Planctomycetes bacterium]|nr:hypothetical protein [Planctomycetota bacterium]